MKIINCNEKTNYILNEFSPDDAVQHEASEYWYLDLYIITLNDVEGVLSSSRQKYMVLEYPSYTEMKSDNIINDCIWSVPHMAYLFHKTGIKRYKTVKSIMEFYEEQILSHKDLFSELENNCFYHMGISDYQKIKGRQYIEYKISPAQPDRWKCYYIQEHYITQIDSLGLLNLADPEGLYSYRYYPLISQQYIKQNIIYFAGKPLSSNVVYLLKTSYNKLIEYSNSVPDEVLRYQLYGIVFKIDIVGFTMMYNQIVDEMKSLSETGKEIALHFVAGISNIFEKRLQEFGISQFIIEGDGLTGMLPLKDNCEAEKGVKLIIECINLIKEDINTLASKLTGKIRLRCSIIAGNYIYGKLAGLSSTRQVTGAIMISLSRMDQFLQNYIKEFSNLPYRSIILCVENQLYKECKYYFKSKQFVKLTSETLYRETIINSTVLNKEV